MFVRDAQLDLRRAFVGGGPGVFVSSMVWCTAALVEHFRGVGVAFAVLFVGGMLIFPLGTAASRIIFGRARESRNNPFGALALESTITMIGGLFAAWLFLPLKPDYVFPLAAIAVGTHYFVFKTVYGDQAFWGLGGLITAIGLIGVFRPALIPGGPILAVGLIELLFAVVMTARALRTAEARELDHDRSSPALS